MAIPQPKIEKRVLYRIYVIRILESGRVILEAATGGGFNFKGWKLQNDVVAGPEGQRWPVELHRTDFGRNAYGQAVQQTAGVVYPLGVFVTLYAPPEAELQPGEELYGVEIEKVSVGEAYGGPAVVVKVRGGGCAFFPYYDQAEALREYCMAPTQS